MAAHSSVLAWRIPGMGEPGGLLSMGSHTVEHDWSDLAAAAAAFIGSPDAEAEAPILWPPDAKRQLIGKDPRVGKVEGKRRREIRWLDSITNSMDMKLSKLWETVENRGTWHAAVCEITVSDTISDWTSNLCSYRTGTRTLATKLLVQHFLDNIIEPLHKVHPLRLRVPESPCLMEFSCLSMIQLTLHN